MEAANEQFRGALSWAWQNPLLAMAGVVGVLWIFRKQIMTFLGSAAFSAFSGLVKTETGLDIAGVLAKLKGFVPDVQVTPTVTPIPAPLGSDVVKRRIQDFRAVMPNADPALILKLMERGIEPETAKSLLDILPVNVNSPANTA